MTQLANSTTTRYTQDLASPLSQVLQTTQGSATTSYLYGLERLASRSGATRTWYLGDALGSARRTLDDSGAVLGTTQYDPWGNVEGGVAPSPFGFAGELQDPATGLVNLRARWYSSSRGTFTSPDPFEGRSEQPTSLQRYTYAWNQPSNLTDPSGRDPWWAEPPRRGENYQPTPYEQIEWQRLNCLYGEVLNGADGLSPQCHSDPFFWVPNCVRGEPGCQTVLTPEQGKAGISIALDFAPYYGVAKGVAEACLGYDLITGEELEAVRWMGLVPFIGKLRGEGKAGKWIIILAEDVEKEGNAGRKIVKAVQAGTVVLDANALINGLEKGELAAIDRAIAGRTPIVSITAAKEFLKKGDVNVLREFLKDRGGRIGAAATEAQIADLQAQARLLDRVLRYRDAATAGTAVNEGATILTRDQRFLKFLRAVGLPVEGY